MVQLTEAERRKLLFQYTPAHGQAMYAKVFSVSDCYQLSTLENWIRFYMAREPGPLVACPLLNALSPVGCTWRGEQHPSGVWYWTVLFNQRQQFRLNKNSPIAMQCIRALRMIWHQYDNWWRDRQPDFARVDRAIAEFEKLDGDY